MKKLFLTLIAAIIGTTAALADTDITGKTNLLYFAPITVEAGKKATISVCMKNNEPVQAIGLKFKVSEGLSVPYETYEDLNECEIFISPARTSKHSLASNYLPHLDEYRVAILSYTGRTFSGEDGEVFTIEIKADENMTPGDYSLRMYEVELSDRAQEWHEIPGTISRYGVFEGTIQVIDPNGVDEVSANSTNGIDLIYNINGTSTTQMQPGINIIKQKDGSVIKVVK